VQGSAPSETEKATALRVGAESVGSPAIPGSSASTVRKNKTKQDDSNASGSTGTLAGSRWGQAALKRDHTMES
jgi:hypothetical protein